VEIRLEIDLNTDAQDFYDDESPLYVGKSWSHGMQASGAVNIAAVDLYAIGTPAIYCDDLSLVDAAPSFTLTKSITSCDLYSTVGGTINYSHAVRNSGNVSLAGPATVSDDQASASCPAVSTVGNLDANLDPGESLACTASHTVTQADLNVGSLTNHAPAHAAGIDSNQDQQTATASPGLLFDPPSGWKVLNAANLPELEWRMVWINSDNNAAINVQIIDLIPAGTTYVPASLACLPQGTSSTTTCNYDSINNRIF
jgi:uncharacterized repeat protein (TIGR01451 family)